MTTLQELELINLSQDIYNGFNTFILSEDSKLFNKLIARALLYNDVKDLPGDIIECGVFKGTGLYTFLKLKRIFNPNSNKRVIGFDFFDTDKLKASLQPGTDKDAMALLFEKRDYAHNVSAKQALEENLVKHGFLSHEFELVAGDASYTTKQFTAGNPGLSIALLYMDVDLEEPTYNVLQTLWPYVIKGGLVIFDEYGYHKWSETRGVNRFVEENNLELRSLNYLCPTAYLKK